VRLKWDQTSKWFEVRVILDLVGVENSCDYRLLQENGRGMMVGVERLKHIPKNETIPIKTLFHINTVDASIFIWTKPLCSENGTNNGITLYPPINYHK